MAWGRRRMNPIEELKGQVEYYTMGSLDEMRSFMIIRFPKGTSRDAEWMGPSPELYAHDGGTWVPIRNLWWEMREGLLVRIDESEVPELQALVRADYQARVAERRAEEARATGKPHGPDNGIG